MQGREETRRTWRVSESAREKEPTVSLHLLGVKDTRASYAAKRTGLLLTRACSCFYVHNAPRARRPRTHTDHTHTYSTVKRVTRARGRPTPTRTRDIIYSETRDRERDRSRSRAREG